MTPFHPVQPGRLHELPEAVALAAYEVYVAIYGAQPAMVDVAAGCRGGFTATELIALLYARGFPRAEWRDRFESALLRRVQP